MWQMVTKLPGRQVRTESGCATRISVSYGCSTMFSACHEEWRTCCTSAWFLRNNNPHFSTRVILFVPEDLWLRPSKGVGCQSTSFPAGRSARCYCRRTSSKRRLISVKI